MRIRHSTDANTKMNLILKLCHKYFKANIINVSIGNYKLFLNK